MTPLQMVREFSERMEQPLDQEWVLDSKLEDFRTELVKEEFEEFFGEAEPEAILKEMADLVYVVYGYAATFGWDLDTALKRVHESNMSKLGDDGKPVKREDGKVIKGPNYKKPDLGDLV